MAVRAERRSWVAVGDASRATPAADGRWRCEPSDARGWPLAMRAERRTRMAVGDASRECLPGWSHFAALDDLRGWCRMAGALESLMGHVETRRDRSRWLASRAADPRRCARVSPALCSRWECRAVHEVREWDLWDAARGDRYRGVRLCEPARADADDAWRCGAGGVVARWQPDRVSHAFRHGVDAVADGSRWRGCERRRIELGRQ